MKGQVQLTSVSKGYRFYQRPTDRLRELWHREPLHQQHWALRDLSLTVAPGETFGVIGENGAGKSTLLKLVAGTSRPSTGQVTVNGRIAALLELGAGFHPEESGEDNVFLMGAIAGVESSRMREYYQEIVAFSELPLEVLARPVKTYSSGMFMRLAFATATAVDPDVLIIDEALAVGDMHFQKKSLDRIMGFRERGKTVLFCSHNIYQVRSLCQRAVWLHNGAVQSLGPTEAVATAFESYERQREEQLLAQPTAFKPTSGGLAPVRIQAVTIPGVEQGDIVESFSELNVTVTVDSRTEAPFHVGIAIVRNDRENIFGTSTHLDPEAQALQGRGEQEVVLRFPRLPLLSGQYWLSVYVLDDSGLQVYDMAEQVCPFTVHNPEQEFGIVHMPHTWELP